VGTKSALWSATKDPEGSRSCSDKLSLNQPVNQFSQPSSDATAVLGPKPLVPTGSDQLI